MSNASSSRTLHFRFGKAVQDPSVLDMRRALDEIFSEESLGLQEADLAEHPNAWLTYGAADGERWIIVTVDVYRGGRASLSRYNDQDDLNPVYEYWRNAMSQDDCLQAWDLVAHCNEEFLVTMFSADCRKL